MKLAIQMDQFRPAGSPTVRAPPLSTEMLAAAFSCCIVRATHAASCAASAAAGRQVAAAAAPLAAGGPAHAKGPRAARAYCAAYRRVHSLAARHPKRCERAAVRQYPYPTPKKKKGCARACSRALLRCTRG